MEPLCQLHRRSDRAAIDTINGIPAVVPNQSLPATSSQSQGPAELYWSSQSRKFFDGKGDGGHLLTALQLLTVAIAAVELAALVLCLTSTPRPNGPSIAAHVVSFVAALSLCQLSILEHGRSVKPSALLIFYLLASAICEGIVMPSFYLNHGNSAAAPVCTVAFCLRFLLLILETINKRSYLREPYTEWPVEQTVSDLNRAFLFWVNDLILSGNSKLLTSPDLPSLDDGLKSRDLRVRMDDAWGKTGEH